MSYLVPWTWIFFAPEDDRFTVQHMTTDTWYQLMKRWRAGEPLGEDGYGRHLRPYYQIETYQGLTYEAKLDDVNWEGFELTDFCALVGHQWGKPFAGFHTCQVCGVSEEYVGHAWMYHPALH